MVDGQATCALMGARSVAADGAPDFTASRACGQRGSPGPGARSAAVRSSATRRRLVFRSSTLAVGGSSIANRGPFEHAAGSLIAIAKLAHPIWSVRPLRLSFTAPTVGEAVRLTGWGATSDVMPVPATHLQTGLLKISAVNAATVMVDGFLPAADTSACLYDSGAPYFAQEPHHRYRLVSVESSGPSCPQYRAFRGRSVRCLCRLRHSGSSRIVGLACAPIRR